MAPILTSGMREPPMPKRYKPFEVMKQTDALERIRTSRAFYGVMGEPPGWFGDEQQVAWLDLINAAPVGVLEPLYRSYLELTAHTLAQVRKGIGGRGMEKLLGKLLRQMGLTPGNPLPATAILGAFKGGGSVN